MELKPFAAFANGSSWLSWSSFSNGESDDLRLRALLKSNEKSWFASELFHSAKFVVVSIENDERV